ncbi:Dyp-type peroxidase [Streptomyces sp. enrichment culture]|uniref:Dyp-type peroxidase n=1 Tax=Streptomyces sp. enrichment culture TaxID=1795815 RepID=UPI003F54580B
MPAQLPLRDSTEIQGDILAGFKKDNVSLLLLQFGDVTAARSWLEDLVPQIATTRQVADFNRRFSEARRNSMGDDPQHLKATWLGLALTHPGFQFFTGKEKVFDSVPGGSTVEAFVQGAADRALALGDTDDSDPKNWLFGYDHARTVHAVLTIASDTEEDLRNELSRQREAASRAGAVVVFQQDGATLPGDAAGKEHFGFKDGVSEPGVRGFEEEDPQRPGYVLGHPGTRLISADKFVVDAHGDGVRPSGVPPWMRNGSFQVFRRLHQDVPGWWAQVTTELKRLKAAKAVDEKTTQEWLAARLVGRWPSGASIANCPMKPTGKPEPAPDNDISFKDDPDGLVTPLFSHLRKTNPRDGLVDGGELVDEKFMDERRMIRRGIPYGRPFNPTQGEGGGADDPRGLVFICYQADLVRQFEFVQADWVNDPDFPHDRPDRPGPDPMVSGQLTDVNDGKVSFESRNAAGERQTTTLGFRPFVRTEGAVYAFSPSLSTLRGLSQGRLEGGSEVPGPGPDPEARPVDAVVPHPEHPDRHLAFRGGKVVPLTSTVRGGDASLAADGAAAQPLSFWDNFTDIKRVDASWPVPDRQEVNGESSHWLFFTGEDGRQYYRHVLVDRQEPPRIRSEGNRARPLSQWSSFAAAPDPVTHVDAVLPIPDKQPGGDGRYYYWVFHTTPAGQRYRIISLQAGGYRDRRESEDSAIALWTSLNGVEHVDAVQPVPGRQPGSAQNWYWVFHGGRYRVISVADGSAHADAVVHPDRPLTG